MMFRFSGLLLRFVDYQRLVPVQAASLGEALSILTTTYPQLRPALHDDAGTLRGAHRLFLNGEIVNRPQRDMSLSDKDTVEFVTMIAGG